jgi:hypothetical protein
MENTHNGVIFWIWKTVTLKERCKWKIVNKIKVACEIICRKKIQSKKKKKKKIKIQTTSNRNNNALIELYSAVKSDTSIADICLKRKSVDHNMNSLFLKSGLSIWQIALKKLDSNKSFMRSLNLINYVQET